MPLVPAICPNCGGQVEVNNSQEAAVCKFCGTPFIVEKAINQYNTVNNIRADVVNVYNGASEFEITAGVLKKYKGESIDVTIPDNVVIIDVDAFIDQIALRSVVIPDSVTEIGSCAFGSCRSLKSVKFGNSVKTIGDAAFRYCESLTEIILPDSLKELRQRAFEGCSNLTTVKIPDSVTEIPMCAFSYCKSLKNFTLPKYVTEIFGNAFQACTSLTAINFPASLTTIGGGAFSYCDGLTEITVPKTVTKISVQAFNECKNLTSVNIEEPQNLKSFENCPPFFGTPWIQRMRDSKLCVFCGGTYKGLLKKVCTRCGRPYAKDIVINSDNIFNY